MLAVLLLSGLVVPALTSTLTAPAHAEEPTYAIEGTVTDVHGQPLPGIRVGVWVRYPGMSTPEPIFVDVGYAETGPSGTYHVDLWSAGAGWGPWVSFHDPAGDHASECFDDQPCDRRGYGLTSVPVVANGTVSGIDAVLDQAASITGRVTTADGAAADNTAVAALSDGGFGNYVVTSVRTDASGHYTIRGLRAATYVLRFTDTGSGLVEYWEDTASESEATPLVAAVGASLSSIDAVIDNQVTNTSAPTIDGTAQVGRTLSASGGSWTPDGTAVTYRWVVGTDTSPTDDPTGSTYVPTAADVGRTIRVLATASRAGWNAGSAWSAPTAAVAAVPATLPPPALTAVTHVVRPRIKGTVRVGQVVKVSKGQWVPSTVNRKYQWYAAGRAIAHATGRRLTLRAKHVGTRLTVRVKAWAPGYRQAIVWTKPTSRVKP